MTIDRIRLWAVYRYAVATILFVSISPCYLHCVDDGFYPNPNDCTKFYRCSHGQQYAFDCAPGTHWNPSLMVCDWPLTAGCQTSTDGSSSFREYDDDGDTETLAPIRMTNFEPNQMEYARYGRQSFPRRFMFSPTPAPSTPQPPPPPPKFFPTTFKPDTLYYDPKTGIYHQFHYVTPNRQRQRIPDQYQASDSRPSVVVIDPENQMTIHTTEDRPSKPQMVFPKLVYSPEVTHHQQRPTKNHEEIPFETGDFRRPATNWPPTAWSRQHRPAYEPENDRAPPITRLEPVHKDEEKSPDIQQRQSGNRPPYQNEKLRLPKTKKPMYEVEDVQQELPIKTETPAVVPLKSNVIYEDEDIENSAEDRQQLKENRPKFENIQREIPVKTATPGKSRVIYEDDEDIEDRNVKEPEDIQETSVVSPMKSHVVYEDEMLEYVPVKKDSDQNQDVQARKFPGENFEHIGPDVILVDGRQVYNVNDSEPLKPEHLGSRARVKSRREKELNENGFEEEDNNRFLNQAYEYDANNSPLGNLSLIHDKIRDFLTSFNQNGLWMEEDTATTTIIPEIGTEPVSIPKLESFVVYENETKERMVDDIARMIGMARKRSDPPPSGKINNQTTGCDGGRIHGPYCHLPPERTGTNFEWLQLADHRFAPNRSQTITTKLAETLAICQEYCWQILTSCAGFSYDSLNQECTLTYEIELDQNGWSPATPGKFLEQQPFFTIGFIMPRWHRAFGNVVMAANLIPVDTDQNLDLENNSNDHHTGIDNTETFFQCLNRCLRPSPETCRYALHNQATKVCLVVRNNTKNTDEDGRFKIRRGWWLGWNQSGQQQLENNQDRFRTETDPALIRLFEQLLVGEDRRYFMGRHLQPKHRLDGVHHQRQCQAECRVTRTCRFVAVYENLLETNQSSGKVSCLFFGEDLVQVFFKLLANEERQQLLEIRAVSGDDDRPVLDGPVYSSGRRRKRRNQIDPPPEPITNISAYVLDQPQPLLKFRILHRETIEESERIISPPFKTWYGAPSEERCYQQCTNSWLSLLDNHDDDQESRQGDSTLCRFLVVRSYHSEPGLKKFNCTFFELSPIAFTEQSWYTVRRIPDRVPPERVEDYFVESDRNWDNDTAISLLDESMYADRRQVCLVRCLQTLAFNGSQRHCFKVHVGRLKSGKYKCRFYDRRRNHGSEPAPSQLYRLGRLPNETFPSIPSYHYVRYFDLIPLNGDTESTLARYQPLHILDNEHDPNNCLKLCIVLWSRIKSGHDDPERSDRCRTVLARRIDDARNETTLFGSPKYRCTIYDVDLLQQARQPEQRSQYSEIDRYPVQVYRVKNGSEPELIVRLDLADFTDADDQSSTTYKAFYHFSGARHPNDCVESRPRSQSGYFGNQLIIAKPMLVDDPILPGHILVRYECLYYDHDPGHQFQNIVPEDRPANDRLAFQLVEMPGTFEYVDPDMESIQFSRRFHQPLFVASQNVTSPARECLQWCSEFNKRPSRSSNNQRSVRCQLVVIEPNRIIQNTTQDFQCWFYNYNASLNRYPDLDRPETVEYYRLVSVPMRTKFDSETMKYEPFERINDTRAVSMAILNDNRQSFRHLTNVTSRQQCFDECLSTWESKLLYYFTNVDPKQSATGFCRTIIVVPVPSTGPELQYECSLYETNTTFALRAFMLDQDRDDRRSGSSGQGFLTSPADSIYLSEEWPLVAPSVTDQTMMLSHPVDMDHCLQECDHKPMARCQAIVTRYQHNRLIRCYFIGSNEYLPDYGTRPTPNHQSKIFVRLFSLRTVPGIRAPDRQTISGSTTNPYLALINVLRGQNGL